MQVLRTETINDGQLMEVLNRDTALWLCDRSISNSEVYEIKRTCRLPWRSIHVESTSAEMLSAIREEDSGNDDPASRGQLYLVASDPSVGAFPSSFKPVFFLNGIDGSDTVSESSSIGKNSALRRRLNMLARLHELEPRRVFLVGNSPLAQIEELVDMWQSEFRSAVTVVCPSLDDAAQAEALLAGATGLESLSWIQLDTAEFLAKVFGRISQLAAPSETLTRLKLASGSQYEVDLLAANLATEPLLETCDLLQVKNLLPVAPADLSEEDFKTFFTKSAISWRPYAASLPWMPDKTPEKMLLGLMNEALGNEGATHVATIVSEPGAGGTTHARALALAAARAGFPTLIIRPHTEVPTALLVTNFLFRSLALIAKAAVDEMDYEPTWLIVLDVEHFRRNPDDFWRFYAELSRSGRRCVLLKVTPSDELLEPPTGTIATELAYINHDLDQNSVANLGRHLNVYLRSFGRQKEISEWTDFWQAHKPDIDTSIASFWIALEFWLAGHLPLGESIQSWVLAQFKDLSFSDEVKLAILEIAALSIERRATPERLLPLLNTPNLPWSYALEDAKRAGPGLGLVSGKTPVFGRVWALAHDVLARHLLNAVWGDRLLCDSLKIAPPNDVVDLRVLLIRRLATRPAMGEAFARPLAIAMATSILKIDEKGGNPEFFRHWKDVLSLLDGVPESIIKTSRTFNHHVAISRRRVTQSEIFEVTPSQKRQLLIKARDGVLFALTRITVTADDESDLNLYNTLALIYQDLAILERSISGDKIVVAAYLASADEATRNAMRENSSNSYVLETAAKSMLRRGYELEGDARVEAAAQALSYVFQATTLETASFRTMSLGNLANEALSLIRGDTAMQAVGALCARGNPFGFVAKAWLCIAPKGSISGAILEGKVRPDDATSAIAILRESPERQWPLVQMEYQLAAASAPSAYDRQLQLLDELDGFVGYRLSLQQRLERAVLLYQEGRHVQATKEFDKLRREVRTSDAILSVPDRLRWLLTSDRSRRAVCTARVLDSSSGRPMAQVSELSRTHAPFNAQEFAVNRMATGQSFRALVTFSAMGPFLKPIDGSLR